MAPPVSLQSRRSASAECYNSVSTQQSREAPGISCGAAHSRGVAQPGRAPGSGPGGRRFKSSLPDQFFQALKLYFWFSVYIDGVDFVDGHIFLDFPQDFHRDLLFEPLVGSAAKCPCGLRFWRAPFSQCESWRGLSHALKSSNPRKPATDFAISLSISVKGSARTSHTLDI